MSQALNWKLYKHNHYHTYLDNTNAPVSQPQRNALKILNCFCMLYIQKVIPHQNGASGGGGPISIGKPSVAREMSHSR